MATLCLLQAIYKTDQKDCIVWKCEKNCPRRPSELHSSDNANTIMKAHEAQRQLYSMEFSCVIHVEYESTSRQNCNQMIFCAWGFSWTLLEVSKNMHDTSVHRNRVPILLRKSPYHVGKCRSRFLCEIAFNFKVCTPDNWNLWRSESVTEETNISNNRVMV